MVSESPWVRVLVGPRSDFAPVPFGGQCGSVLGLSEQHRYCLAGSGIVPSRFGIESN